MGAGFTSIAVRETDKERFDRIVSAERRTAVEQFAILIDEEFRRRGWNGEGTTDEAGNRIESAAGLPRPRP